MSKLFVFVALLAISFGAFADVPIVYSKCKATPHTLTKTATVTLSDSSTQTITKTFKGMTLADRMPEVNYSLSTQMGNDEYFITPCDLVYRDASGNETVIEDCSSTATVNDTCSALDAAVSFDGTEILYSVFKGTVINRQVRWYHQVFNIDAVSSAGWEPLPNWSLNSAGSHIKRHVVGGATTDVTTYSAGTYDSGPIYLSNGRIAFTSNRTGHHANVVHKTTAAFKGMALWTADLDGTNIELASAHSRTQEQHPFQLKNGLVAYSSWQTGMGVPHSKTQGSFSQHGTLINFFKAWAQYPDGSRQYPILGQHQPQATVNSSGDAFAALHYFTQLPNEDFCTTNYYRGNNFGSGGIICSTLPTFTQEGQDPQTVINYADGFMPSNTYELSSWSDANDQFATMVTGFPSTTLTHSNYASKMPWNGKLGWPFAIPAGDGALGVTWAAGACGTVTTTAALVAMGVTPNDYEGGGGEVISINALTRTADRMAELGYGDDIPGCDIGIYKVASLPISSPADLVKIVDEKGWHEIMPRAVVPYTNIYGVSAPTVLNPIKSTDLGKGSPFGFVGAASITDRETLPKGGVPDHASIELSPFHLQGTDTIEFTDSELCGVRFMQMHHNDSFNSYQEVFGYTGERVAILGEIYTRNKDGNGDPILDPSGNEDTSFLVSIPANVPYTMAGIDCQGRNLNIDQTWQHVKPEEIKTCGGCHLHSRNSRITFAQSQAADAGYTPFELGHGTVPLLTGTDVNGDPVYSNENGYGIVVNFDEHIKPIFQARCISCHGTVDPSAGLDLNNYPANNVTAGSTYYRLVYDNEQTYVPSNLRYNYPGASNGILFRPFVSKYIRAFNSRSSLLYWKAANERTDNRTDGEITGDLDFGTAHPVAGITSAELGWIARWIDTGAQAGPGITTDKMPPTIHMAVTLNVSDEITDIVIGTVDLGSGIDPATLDVRIVTNGTPGANLAGPAQMHGITSITLGAPQGVDATKSIRASVNDNAGNTRQIEYTVNYLIGAGDTGAPPSPDPVSISVGGNATITEGDTFSRTITFSDGADTNTDGWTYDIDWCGTPDNGNTVAAGNSSFNISRLFSTAGSCAVTITITDDVGETDIGSFTITINAAGSPGLVTISTGGRALVKEGSVFTRTISISDPTDANSDGHTYILKFDGVQVDSGSIPPGVSSFDITQAMPDGDKRVSAEVTVTDTGGDVTTQTFDIIVQNVPPVATIGGSSTVTANTTYSITLQITDPGDDTINAKSIDWGDGTTNNSLTHVYATPGNYTIRVWVDDEDGLWMAGYKRITVN